MSLRTEVFFFFFFLVEEGVFERVVQIFIRLELIPSLHWEVQRHDRKQKGLCLTKHSYAHKVKNR
jgi:hypothetical protein